MSSSSHTSGTEQDRDDLGRVLQALLEVDDRPPEETAREYLTDDLRHTTNRRPVKIQAGIFSLSLPPGALIATGGGGIIVQCVNRQVPSIKYALKVVRPSLLKGRLADVADTQQRVTTEFLNHAPLSHKNIARVFGAGSLTVTVAQRVELHTAPILMEWIEDAKPLCAYIADKLLPWRASVELLIECFEAVAHLHSAGLVHWDMKSENFLVDRAGVARLIDIGNARRPAAAAALVAFSTKWNVPPYLLSFFDAGPGPTAASSRRTPINLPDKEWDAPWLDLWMFGRELNRLFDADAKTLELDREVGHPDLAKHRLQRDRFLPSVFPVDDLEAAHALGFLRLVIKRLLYPYAPAAPAFYKHAQSVATDLTKLLQPLGAAHDIPELQGIPQHVLRLPVSGNVPYTPRFAAIYNSSLIQRLNSHLQLGTLAQVYPGATHRRSEHSAGVFATAVLYVRALYANQTQPFWRLSIERRDIDALLLAALIHDAGHVAYGHFLEEQDGVFRGRTHEDYLAKLLAPDEPLNATPELLADRAELREIIEEHWTRDGNAQAFLNDVGAILTKPANPELAHDVSSLLLPQSSQTLKIQMLHSVIDSAIDADKLDYLFRDAHHCNVSYSRGIDIDRFYQSLTPIPLLLSPKIDVKTHACFGVSEKGIAPLESILVARYQMFSSVYWQHTARAETAMLQFLVQEYVAADVQTVNGKEAPSLETVNARLDELVNQCRRLSDGQALRWIRERVSDTRCILSLNLQRLLRDICDALLGARSKLYWPAFALHYKRAGGDTQSLAEWLVQHSDSQAAAPNIYEFVSRARAFRRLLGAKLQPALGLATAFGDGDILIDIPPAGKDQIENIFVWTPEAVRPIQDLSPIADSVRDAFRYWVRKLRVFLSPPAWERCASVGISEKRLHRETWETLIGIQRALNPQQALFDVVREEEGEQGGELVDY